MPDKGGTSVKQAPLTQGGTHGQDWRWEKAEGSVEGGCPCVEVRGAGDGFKGASD